jgi:phospholipid/cholesterol/gamma-HCH transport system substrate-binding protein
MADQLKNMMIGLFVLAAVAIIVFALMFLHPSVGDERRVLRVRFVNIDKISVGTRVTFAGKPVGEVAAINELKDAITERKARDGVIYVYELILHVDSQVNVFNSDEITAHTSGLLGEKSVNITPLPPKPGVPLRIVNDEILFAIEVGSVEDTLVEFKGLALKFDTALDSINTIFTEINDEQIIKKASDTLQNVSDITAALNQPENLSQIVDNFHTLSQRVLTSWDTVDQTLVNMKTLTNDGKDIIATVKKGQGTVGRLVMNDQLYLKLNSLLSKGETVFNDINHYGLLFNQDKGWQRLRARRLNLLYTLSTPQEFRNFFNDEMDQINTSLSRVYSIVESTNCAPFCCDLFDNPEFQKVYAELLRRVTDTEEALKMYNQQLVETEAKKTELCQ